MDQCYTSWKTTGGNDTLDRVFLLSFMESKNYFQSDMNRRGSPTATALNKGTESSFDNLTTDGGYTCGWWLRSPGYDQSQAMFVDGAGELKWSARTDAMTGGVRPALWVDISLFCQLP